MLVNQPVNIFGFKFYIKGFRSLILDSIKFNDSVIKLYKFTSAGKLYCHATAHALFSSIYTMPQNIHTAASQALI